MNKKRYTECKDCIYRAGKSNDLGNKCAYLYITGHTRTKYDKPLDWNKCEQYVKQDAEHPRLRKKKERPDPFKIVHSHTCDKYLET